MNMYLGRKESTEYNLGESFVLNLASALDDSYCTLVFDNFFASPNLFKHCLIKKITVLELFNQIERICRYFPVTNHFKEATANSKHAKM